MCFCEFDGPSISWENLPTARKEHICCECGETIHPGDTYHLFRGIWDGEFGSYKTCDFCDRVREDLIAEDPCICFRELWKVVDQEFGGGART